MSMIAARARADGVKVLLSGEGADELFAGHELSSTAPSTTRSSRRGPAGTARGAGAGARPRPGGGAAAGSPRPWAMAARAGRIAARLRAALGRLRRDPCHGGAGARPGRRSTTRAPGELEAVLLVRPLPHLLSRQDKNTMQASIETRVPFLDPLSALALSLPLEARTRPRCARASCRT